MLEDVRPVRIEADHHAAANGDAVLDKRSIDSCRLRRRFWYFFVSRRLSAFGRLDADEDGRQPGVGAELDQLAVFGGLDRRLGVKRAPARIRRARGSSREAALRISFARFLATVKLSSHRNIRR